MFSSLTRAAIVASLATVLTVPAAADPVLFTPAPLDEAFFGFGARVSHKLSPFAGYEDNYIIGAGYQRFVVGSPDSFRLGFEVGIAGRFGATHSAEIWGGIVGRADFEVLDVVRISPALTFGLSAVTGTMAGSEQYREAMTPGSSATLLFYLGPEVSFSLADHPETEVFVRLHHRSGAWGTLGNMHSGLDSYGVGLRHQF